MEFLLDSSLPSLLLEKYFSPRIKKVLWAARTSGDLHQILFSWVIYQHLKECWFCETWRINTIVNSMGIQLLIKNINYGKMKLYVISYINYSLRIIWRLLLPQLHIKYGKIIYNRDTWHLKETLIVDFWVNIFGLMGLTLIEWRKKLGDERNLEMAERYVIGCKHTLKTHIFNARNSD